MGLQKQFNAGCLGSMFICGGLVSAALAHISSMWASATAATRGACAFVQKQSRTNAGTKVPTRSDKSLKRLIAPIRPPTIGGAAARYLQVVCSPGVNRTFKHAFLSLETHESHSQPRLGGGGHRNNFYMQLRAPKSGLALYVDSRLKLERRASADVVKRSDSRAIPSGASIPRCAIPNVKNYRLTTD